MLENFTNRVEKLNLKREMKTQAVSCPKQLFKESLGCGRSPRCGKVVAKTVAVVLWCAQGISYCQEVSRRWQGRQSSERTIAVLNKTLLCLKQRTRATHHRHVMPQMCLITVVLITAGLM